MKTYLFIIKVIKFFKNYLFKDPIFVFKYFVAYFQKDYTPQVKFYNTEEFMAGIRSGKSFIRIGDGEIGLLHHRDIHYQKAAPLLVSKVKEIIVDYKQDSQYILSMPIFVNTSNKDLESTKGKLSCWLPLKVEFFRRFNKDMKYFDAHAFYRKGFFENNMYQYLKDKKLIINTRAENIKNQKENIEKRFEVLEWIEAKSPNPFDLYEDTKARIQNIINLEIAKAVNHKKALKGKGSLDIDDLNKEEFEKEKKEIEAIKKDAVKDIVLILGSGPMSKVLAYDFAQQGVQGIDIGKGFEQLYNEVDYEHEI